MKQVKPDNLYDTLFNTAGSAKEAGNKKMIFSGAPDFDVLERDAQNVQVLGSSTQRKGGEVDKWKLSK